LNVGSENAVHVGDDIVDVEGALGAGMQAVQIDRHSSPNSKGLVDGVPVIGTLSELLLLIAK
jgi:FMN phosphatase YigB (HAD superfamily)